MALARRAPRARRVEWRLALANLHRPGALTPSVVLSLGLGLAVLVALTLVDANLRAQLAPDAAGRDAELLFPRRAQRARPPPSATFSNEQAPGAKIVEAPMMRGRIVSIGGVAAEKVKAQGERAWALEGDRGVTFADDAAGRLRDRRRRLVADAIIPVRRWSRWRTTSPRGSA